MPRGEVIVGGDRVVVAARLLLAAPHDERPEHVGRVERLGRARDAQRRVAPPGGREGGGEAEAKRGVSGLLLGLRDRKSTRLNSSHLVISYAVFCLKKKKKKSITVNRSP